VRAGRECVYKRIADREAMITACASYDWRHHCPRERELLTGSSAATSTASATTTATASSARATGPCKPAVCATVVVISERQNPSKNATDEHHPPHEFERLHSNRRPINEANETQTLPGSQTRKTRKTRAAFAQIVKLGADRCRHATQPQEREQKQKLYSCQLCLEHGCDDQNNQHGRRQPVPERLN
jgi:hypothetical protein